MKLTPKESALYRSGYKKGCRDTEETARTHWYNRGFEEGRRAAYLEIKSEDPPPTYAKNNELVLLDDLLTANPSITTPEGAAAILGWRLKRARRVWEAYHHETL